MIMSLFRNYIVGALICFVSIQALAGEKYKLALMNSEEFEKLSSLTNRQDREQFVDSLKPQLGEDYLESYDGVKLYLTEDGTEYVPITDKDFLTLYKKTEFKEAVREITDVDSLPQCLAGMSGPNGEEVDLWILVFCKLLDEGLDPADIGIITDLGGRRGCDTPRGHTPIYKPLLIKAKDPACIGMPTHVEDGETYCTLQYDAALITKSYEELLGERRYLELYAKSREHWRDGANLGGRVCFLNKLADHLKSPHIKRIFVEETGTLSPRRVNPRAGDFRRDLVGKLEGGGNQNSCEEELVVKLADSTPDAISIYRQEVKDFYDDEIAKLKEYRERLLEDYRALEELEKKMSNKDNIERHLKCMKLLDTAYGVSKYWQRMYDETKSQELRKEMDACGGRDLSNFYSNSYYSDAAKYNQLSQRLEDSSGMYFRPKEKLLLTLRERKRLFNDISENEILKIFEDEGLMLDYIDPNDPRAQGIKQSFLSSIKNDNGDSFSDSLAAYNALDRQFLRDIRMNRDSSIQDMLKEFDSIQFANISTSKTANTKDWGIKIKLNPIKVPTLRDIGRELGGVVDSAGNVVNSAGQIVVNVVDEVKSKGEELCQNVGREMSQLKLHVEREGAKFEKYMRRDFGADLDNAINNIIIKPINWIFCGGKQPPDNPSEDDGCVDGGIECTSRTEGTDCRLTDSQGNPSDVPTPDELITEEQLQWMRDMELQDMVNSMDFSDRMNSWMNDPSQAGTLQRMLASKQKELYEKSKNLDLLDTKQQAELALEIKKQKEILDLIMAGAGAAGENVVQTFKDMINIAKTAEELKATISFVAENGLDGLAVSMGEAFTAYWDEFNASDDVGKAEIIGRVASDIIMAIAPTAAIARIGKGAVKSAAASSKIANRIRRITESAQKYLGKVSGSQLGEYMGTLRKAGKTKGNFDFPSGNRSEAKFFAESWVGPDSIKKPYKNHPGKFIYESRDGTKIYREPVKKRDGRMVSNFQWRSDRNSNWAGNGHMEIKE